MRRGAERCFRLYGDFGADFLHEALEYRAGTQFGEFVHAVGQHVLHDVGPAHGSRELGDQVGLDLFGIGIGFGIYILVDGACGRAERCFGDGFGQFYFCGLHEGRVERAAHGQTQRTFGSGLLGLDAGGLHGLHGARNHELPRAVVVGGYDRAFGLVADPLHDGIFQSEHCGHRSGLLLAGGLHGQCALRHQAQTVLEGEGARNDESREFAQRVSGHGVGFHAQGLGQDDRVEEDGGLGDLRLFEFFVRTREHDVGDAESEDFVGLLEERLGLGHVFVEVFAHAYRLGSLTGEYVCVFHHFRRFSFDAAKIAISKGKSKFARIFRAGAPEAQPACGERAEKPGLRCPEAAARTARHEPQIFRRTDTRLFPSCPRAVLKEPQAIRPGSRIATDCRPCAIQRAP